MRPARSRRLPASAALVACALVGVGVGIPAAAADDRPATRDEANAACFRGCGKRLDDDPQLASLTKEQRRIVCDETCDCIINSMFERDGKPKRPPRELGIVAVGCGDSARKKVIARIGPTTAPATAAPAAAPAAPVDNLSAGRAILPGVKCKKASMPAWTYSAGEHQARISGLDYQVRLPAGWLARVERPELVVVSAPQSARGVRPVFELFVSPICESYDAPTVAQRIAARGLTQLLAVEATAAQVRDGRWSGGLGGPVGVSLILYDVALKTAQGERKLTLYVTDLGATKTFGIHASAVCPSAGSPSDEGPCEKSYFAMLQSAGAAK